MEGRIVFTLTQTHPPLNSNLFPVIPHVLQLRQFKNHNPYSPNRSRPNKNTTGAAASYRKWDSNAETARTRGFGFNQNDVDEEEEEFEEDDYGSRSRGKKRRWWSDELPGLNDSLGGFEDAIDGVWIFKAFKSLGWLLPAVIVPLLVTTGPKAFLMALALPLGQSALTLAFDKLWGGTQSRTKRKTRARRKSSPSPVNNEEMEAEKEEDISETKKRKMGYQSWEVGNNSSFYDVGKGSSSFGGWDELDRMGSIREPSRKDRGSQRKPVEKGKLSRNQRKSDTPLLLRLLIAVFPFLGYWTKMLL